MTRRGGGTRRGLPGVAPPADRRFHRSDLPIDRRRRLGRTVWRTARVASLAALVAVVGWGGFTLAGSDVFRVRDLVVTGNQQLTDADVERLAQGLRGEHILQVNLARYADQIKESTWVEDVSLFRILPVRIEVRIRERRPMVIARSDQRLYLVDERGIIIDEYGAEYRRFDLPVVDGLVSESPGGGLDVEPDRTDLVRALVGSLGSRPGLGRRISQIDVSNARDVRVLIDDDPAWLHLGQERFVERMEHYLELRETLRVRFSEIDYVDLRFEERVFIQPGG